LSLIERLARRDSRPVVSVVAPHGYGKTTLLSQWAERNGHSFAWVSVEEPDNDPKVLLTYVAERAFLTRTAVLERMCGPLCEAVLDLPGPPRPWPIWRGRTCCWCRWTGGGSGTATIICSATCSWPTSNASSPA
jgi:hypothetical protein